MFANIIATQLPHIPEYIRVAAEWFFFTVFLKYIVAKYIAEKIKDFLTRGRYDAITWEHYRMKARGLYHQTNTPEECHDGACKLLKTIPPVRV